MAHSEAALLFMSYKTAIELWYPAHAPTHKSPTRDALHDVAIARIGASTDVRYLEFGVHKGATVTRFASAFTNPQAEFLGFDSFIGLPEDWNQHKRGAFATGGNIPNTTDPRIRWVKGWFQNSTRDVFREISDQKSKTTLIHFDADLYSSTLFLLASLWWCIPEYYFIFDEFVGQEIAALRTFMTAYPVEVEFYSRTDIPSSGEPLQIFGRLRATRMVVEALE